jgi:hypothetical protein
MSSDEGKSDELSPAERRELASYRDEDGIERDDLTEEEQARLSQLKAKERKVALRIKAIERDPAIAGRAEPRRQAEEASRTQDQFGGDQQP